MSGIGYGGVVDYAPVTSATATREMAVTGMGDGGVCAGGPSLVLNFGVSPTGTTPTLDPRITFSRASNATYFDSTGTLQYAPHNLLTYSEQFDNSVWGATAGTVSANSTTAPDGTTTADTFTESTGSVDPRFPVNTSLVTGNTYALSVYAKVKPNSAQRYLMLVFNAGFAAVSGVNFDLVAGTVGASANATGTIEAIGDGWYRCSMIPSGTATASGSFRIRLSNVNTASNITSPTAYTGDGTSGIYVWGAQLNVGALQPYYSTTVKNLQGYSQEFNNAVWSKFGATISADVIAAPDGSNTADKLVEDSSTGPHYTTPSSVTALTLGQVVTYSVYAKAAERTFLQLILTGIGSGSSNYVAGFNLATGVAGTPSSGATSNILSVGDGWFRCQLTVTVLTAATPTRQIRVSQNASSTPSSYTGDGTSGIYVWGAQFSDSASLDAYTYNPVAAPSAAAYYGPRFDYNPSTLAARGLLIEEQRTNSLRNSTMQGAVAGTPGTLPTNWAITNGGLSIDVAAIGTESGISYIDLRFSGTSTGTVANVRFEANTQITAASGQTWTNSVFIRQSAGSTTNITSVQNIITGRDSGGTTQETFSSTITSTLTAASISLNRSALTATLANASTARIVGQVNVNFSVGVAIDITLRIGLPQLEQGAFATSVIPTSTTALTRSADVASMQGANFSNWYNPVEGTLITTTLAINQTFPPNRYVSTMDDGTTNNIIGAYIATDLNAASFVVNGGVAVYQEIITTVSNTSPNSIAVTYKANDFMSAANGVLGIPDTSGAIPVVNKITFGNRSDGARPLNGHIRSFKYYPTRLRNGNLQALTS